MNNSRRILPRQSITLVIVGVFLWAIVIPFNAQRIVTFSIARDIIRHGCSAVIDDSRQKFRSFPLYTLETPLKQAAPVGILTLGFWASLVIIQFGKQWCVRAKLKQRSRGWAFSTSYQFINFFSLYQRPPPTL